MKLSHPGYEAFECEICKQKFTETSILKKHLKTMHDWKERNGKGTFMCMTSKLFTTRNSTRVRDSYGQFLPILPKPTIPVQEDKKSDFSLVSKSEPTENQSIPFVDVNNSQFGVSVKEEPQDPLDV